MRYRALHEWTVSIPDAIALQRELREQVIEEPLPVGNVRWVSGADISFDKGSDAVFAGFVTYDIEKQQLTESVGLRVKATFPYVPGLLSFREAPPLLEAWEMLQTQPDALICDGHGYAHPRRFGIACHLGLLLDLPTVGCAKSVLVGTYEPPGPARGDWSPLIDRGEMIGAALRTRENVSPVFVSRGHRSDLESAIALVLRCGRRTRVPETTRYAHAFVNELRRADAAANGR